jgi:hypothetical protein
MDADAHVNLFGGSSLRIVRPEPRLNLLRTLDGVDGGGEIDQEAIAHRFDDLPVVIGHQLVDELVMGFQQLEGARLVAAHLAAKADDVGEHNCRQPLSLGLLCAAGVFLHRSGLFC